MRRLIERITPILLAVTILTPRAGVNWFNDGLTIHKETYYNLNMKRVIRNAANNGITGIYQERADGVKTYNNLVIVAANQSRHPYGSVVMTSLGPGIVLDTGSFARSNPEQYDIAVTW